MSVILAFAAMLFLQVPAVVTPGQNGVVTGQVRGSGGVPATGVRVAAMVIRESSAPAGEGALVSLTQTDASGRYRLENIPPGRYYIQAGLIDLPTYYPGVSSTTGATSVQVTSRAEVSGIDFTLARPQGVRVSGRVFPGISMVRLVGGTNPMANTATINADGSFEFPKVTPGTYTLMAIPTNVLPNVSIVVFDQDIVVGVPSGPGVKVSGRIGFGPNSPKAANLKVILIGTAPWSQLEAVVDASGTFQLPVVPSGTYSIRTVPGSATALSTLIVADREISSLLLPAYIELQGRMIAESLPALAIALMIEAKRNNGSTLATAIRQDGTFKLPIHEGEYRLSMGKLPAGVSVKSFMYGSVDLLKEPLRLNGSAGIGELRLTLETSR